MIRGFKCSYDFLSARACPLNGLGVGSVVQLIRSGDVIPKVHKMIHKTEHKTWLEISA